MNSQPAPPESSPLPAAATLRELAQQTLARARRAGASAAEVTLSEGTALTVNVRKGEIESVEFQRDRDLGITVYFGQRRGHASTSDLSDRAIGEAIERACAIARYTGEDPYAGLADPERIARDLPDLDLDHPWPLTVDAAVALAREAESIALQFDPRITNSEGAGVDTRRGISVYANSHGFVGHQLGTQHSLSCAVIAGTGEDMQRDYWYSAARTPAALETAAQVGRRAAERSLARLHPRRLSTRRAPVLFVPELARGLFGSFVGAISGGALYRKASFLLDQAGKPVFAPQVNISQRPHLPRAMGSTAYDQEGVATVDRELVVEGVLQGYVLGSYSARRLGLQSTGNAGGVFNLVVQPGPSDFAGLLREMGTGLVVTELMGQGVNLVTGDYSRGAAGFWVEQGSIAYPVAGITIAGNLRDMFRGVRAIGHDMDTRGNIRSGSVLIESMTIAGQ
ncbi:MAG TPA: metalloprotease PmbA [Nevskiales bacterium]|nr:metalloprotease PmbA [Nevskiales bacterium]